MSEVFKTAIRATVVNDSTVQGLIDFRFFPAHISTVADPEFPAANILLAGGAPDKNMQTQFYEPAFRLYAWSADDFDQAHEIYRAMHVLLDRQLITTATARIVCTEIILPEEQYSDKPQVYGVMGGWTAQVVEI